MKKGMVHDVASTTGARPAAPDEQLREEIAARAVAIDDKAQPGLTEFTLEYFARVAEDDLTARGADHLAHAMLAHLDLARHREPGTELVRIHTPSHDGEGWDGPHTIVDVVNDDMPFLVDSLTMALGRHDLGVHLVVHPIVEVRRDGSGTLTALGPAAGALREAGAEQVLRESWVHIEIDRETDADVVAAVEADLHAVLHDVRAATADWKPMLDAVRGVIAELETAALPLSRVEIDEGIAFLRWLADDHFTFLGFRAYDLLDDDTLCAVAPTGLGLLRETKKIAPPSTLPGKVKAKVREPQLLVLTKTNARSTIHRPTYLDYVGVKRFDERGRVVGEYRFLGLYTSSAYTASPMDVPVLRRKVDEVITRAGFLPASHDQKDLVAILEHYPRDDLFQIDTDRLREITTGILQLQERRRVRLFVSWEPYGRFVSCLVFLPRDRYTTPVRERIANLLLDAFGGSSVAWNTYLSASVLARLHYVVRVDPAVQPIVDVAAVERQVAAAARAWLDDLRDRLIAERGEEPALDLWRTWGAAFPGGYQDDVTPAEAAADLVNLESLAQTPLSVRLVAGRDHLDLKLYGIGRQPSLSDVLPRLTNMGVTVDDEHPYTLTPAGLDERWIKHFRLRAPEGSVASTSVQRLFEDAFLAVVRGDAEDDGFNRLVLGAGLAWREVALLRGYARYLRQTGTLFSQSYIEDALAAHADIARRLVELFVARLDPWTVAQGGSDPAQLVAEITAMLDAVTSLDEDRILRSLLHLIVATLRTDWFQNDANGDSRPGVVLKLDPLQIPDLPLPRPTYEVFVYSPRVEGVHLRTGKVARGGIRWSDRREDFRTEILGLMKAQRVKNAVIVPTGAKGGFVVKRPPADPAALRDEVEACYREFITGLLRITDNLVDGAVVPPDQIVRYDGDDPYLVVAADKGTATFSDIANELAIAQNFWLGDAFASGGTHGYDHKAMGITARGAWESVKRHFRHLGIDPDQHDFTVVGIGDMSGDVFGNGMLLSRHIRLVAAFDHRHVFLDPNPDARETWRERQRLFELPRSSWGDYDTSKLSPGGGVYPRTLKAIPVSEEVRARLDLPSGTTTLTPAEMIRAILRAPVDLLYNGGIGTYVKARTERHVEVGDKANDAVRVDGAELRCRAVGEGGNLGFTQLGRVEYALGGGRINTDAIDNSAGVDTSDHEVNIKILLDAAVRAGELTFDERNSLLASMTDDVAALVLRDNYRQARALDNASSGAAAMEDVHARFMHALEQSHHLDRVVERLPSDDTLLERRNAGVGLTVPELAVLLAYAKVTLQEDVLASPLPDDPDFVPELVRYFPPQVREQCLDRIRHHSLGREITTTALVNGMVNRAGTTFAFRLAEETGASAPEIVRAHEAARAIFDQDSLWRAIEALDGEVGVDVQTQMYLEGRKLVERASRWLLRNRRRPLPVAATVATFAIPVAQLMKALPEMARGNEHDRIEQSRDALVAQGVPEELATRVAALDLLPSALDIAELAETHKQAVEHVAAVYAVAGDRLRFDWLADRIVELPRADRWEALARNALREDVAGEHRAVVDTVLRSTDPGFDPETAFEVWAGTQGDAVARTQQLLDDIAAHAVYDLATLSVALRELRALA